MGLWFDECVFKVDDFIFLIIFLLISLVIRFDKVILVSFVDLVKLILDIGVFVESNFNIINLFLIFIFLMLEFCLLFIINFFK